MEYAISVEKLTKSYNEVLAVDNVSFFVESGTFFGLLGENGAGKSTTIECILGTKKANSAEISILGMHTNRERKKLFENVAVQFQQTNYQDQIKVYELCEVTASLYQKAHDPAHLLEKFGLGDKQKSFVKDLSGGERQRLFIVLALIPQPKVVFFDELTTGLDPKARREVYKMLLDLKQKGLTIVLTSHFMDEVQALCDQICILKNGKIVFHGSVSQAIKNSPHSEFEDAYLWYTEQKEDKENESI